MRGPLFDRILASTALALVMGLSVPALSQSVDPEEKARVESRIPVPDTTLPPPPNATDVMSPMPANTGAVNAAPAAAETSSEPANQTATPAPEPVAEPAPATTAAPSPAPAEPAAPSTATAPAAVPAAPTASAPDVAPAKTVDVDPAFADKLRDLITAKTGSRYFARPVERAAAETFYKERNYAPVWSDGQTPSARGAAAVSYLQNVDADGMEPADYPAPNFTAGDIDALAEAELRLTGELLEYARHASMGRVHYSRISNDIGYELNAPEPADVLANIATTDNLSQALDSYQPQHPQYKALKAKLAEARGKAAAPAEEIVRIPEGGKFRVGAEDPRVPLLRKRLKMSDDETSLVYDKDVVEAVKKFQQGAGLSTDGVVGPATLRTLNGVQKRERTADIIAANMERWRWMPRDLGKNYVMLNIPEYRVRLFKDQKLYWETKTVVGKPTQATPLMTGSMKFITVNPTWNVPPSIIAKEYLPAVRQDPTVLDRMGLRMEQNRDGTVRIYQPPGDRNALGRIRFNFPNKFLVYQHDTPDKHLFAHDRRAYSHGCMRVENPLMYGEKLLSIVAPNEKYTAEKLRSMYGPSEININFPTQLPVHLTYQTAFVDDAGNLQIRDDIYKLDSRYLAIVRGDERRVADVATPRAPTGTNISQDQLRFEGVREAREMSPFADWFQSRQASNNPNDRRRGAQVTGPQDFFSRLFR